MQKKKKGRSASVPGYGARKTKACCSPLSTHLSRLFLIVVVVLLIARVFNPSSPFLSAAPTAVFLIIILSLKGLVVLLGAQLGLARDEVCVSAHGEEKREKKGE